MIIPVNNAVIAAPQLRSSLRGRSRPYAMKVTIFFLAQSFLASSLVALLVGRFCGNLLLEKVSNSLVKDRHDQRLQKSLPRIFFRRDKQVPSSIYTSKTFDNGFLTSLDSFLAHPESSGPIVAHENLDRGKTNVGLMEVDGLTVDTIHDPSGQHLLIDIKNVDIEFLNSEERLVSAMIDIVALSDLTLLSYHCHTWKPVGVSCIGVLLESHISLHTWPLQGVIILDLFTCGNKSLLPFLPIIEERFAIPKRSDGEVDLPIVVWSHKKRGFRQTLKNNNLDLDHFILGWRDFDLKKMVLHVEKNSRVIDIYDVIDSRFRRFENYRKSLDKKVSSYESMNPKLFRPDRLVYSNLKMQTRRFGEVEYHESIVHSTMFSHKNPRYVAIVGGGNGAILRELLKHRSVEKVTIFEDINATEMNLSRSFLSDWSFCGDLLDGAASCFDDPRVSLGNIATFDCFEENRMHDVIFWDVCEYKIKVHVFLPNLPSTCT
jgi:S-adenosylmethionine decarboxylase proenzyme